MKIEKSTTSITTIFDSVNWNEVWPAAAFLALAVPTLYSCYKRDCLIAEGNEKIRPTFEAFCKKYDFLEGEDLKVVNVRNLLLDPESNLLSDKRFYQDLALVRALTHQYQVEELLIRNGKESSPLHVICQNDQVDALEILMQSQPFEILTQKDTDGNTPLHVAVKSGSSKVINRMIEHENKGLLLTAQNNKGKTPVHLICQGNMVKLFSKVAKFEGFCDWLKIKNVDDQTPDQIVNIEGSQELKQALNLYKIALAKAR